MSATVTSMNNIIRKSERRKNGREIKKNSDFEICNPYHSNECKTYFPTSLEKQLL
jgi:hypothetical protein